MIKAENLKNMFISKPSNSTHKTQTLQEFETWARDTMTNISRNAILQDDVCMNCINIISDYLACMQPVLYKKEDGKVIKVDDSIVTLLKNRPNRRKNGFVFSKELIVEMLIKGNSYGLIETDKNGLIKSLTMIKDGVLCEEGDKDYIQGIIRNKTIKVDIDKTIQFTTTIDIFKALEPLLLTKTLLNGIVNRNFDDSTASNAIKIVVDLGDSIASTETQLEFKKDFNEVLKANGDYTAILHGGAKLQQLNTQSFSFVDQQVKELMEKIDNKIYAIFKVPQALTGMSQSSQYKVNYDLVNTFIESLLPYILMIEQEYNYKLLPSHKRDIYYFKLNNKNLMRMGNLDKASWYKTMHELEVLSTEQIKQLEEIE